MKTSEIFFYGCMAVCGGVALASLVEISNMLIAALFGAAFFVVIAGAIFKKSSVIAIGLILFCFLFGFCRFNFAWGQAHINEIITASQNATSGEFEAVICGDPIVNAQNQQIIVCPQGVKGKILATVGVYPEYHYGDLVKIFGTLELPQSFNEFDYQNYLAKSGIYATMEKPQISLIAENEGNKIFSALFSIKHSLEKSIERSLPSPQDNLLEAILLGDQTKLTSCSAKEIKTTQAAGGKCAKLKEQFNFSGLRHLAAVSGEHITIMIAVIAVFLIGAGLSRRQTFWVTLIFIWAFIAMIGLPASAVRAGIMGSLMLIAQRLGRTADAFRILVIAAVLMILQNPLVLRFDQGFQLSFLAVIGMIYLSKPLEKYLQFIPKTSWLDLRGALCATLAAQALTLPLQIFSFGYIPIYAAFANIMAAPAVPFITIFGFVLALIGIASQMIAQVIMFPMWLALSYLLAIAKFFAGLPFSSIEIQMPFCAIVLIYAAITAFLYYLSYKAKQNFFLELR